jgi:hypothetical protein
LEPARTNSARNWNFTAGNWNKSGVTATAASGISPDGYNNAYLIKPSSTGTDRFVYDDTGSGGYTANADYTNTLFVKASGINWCYVRFEDKTNANSFIYFNLATGSVGSTLGSVSVTKSIENYGNGWYRIRVTGNMSSGVGGNNNVLFGICDADGSTLVTASGNNGVLFYGPQSEQGSYPTSAIPTLGTAVTRVADDCVKTSATSIIGQTEGVIYINWDYKNSGSSLGNIPICLDSGLGNEVYFYVQSNGNYECEMFVSSVRQFIFSGSLGSFGTKKIAIAYKQNDFALYINGVQIGTDTSGSVPAMNRLYVGRFYGNTAYNIASGISEVLLFKTRLTNEQLAELTSL